MTKLKRCPFCGGKAETEQCDITIRSNFCSYGKRRDEK